MKRQTLEVECWFLIPLVRDSDRGLHQPVLWRLLEEALSDAWGGWTGPETMRWGRRQGAVPGGWKPEGSADPITEVIVKAVYQTITGRRLKLDSLSADERRFLATVEKKFRARPEWSEFASWWVSRFRKARLPASSAVRRICQDLEARLGIAQKKVAAPDYRDYMADLIEERFGSRYKFCEAAGIDPGQLSRVFASRAELSLPALQKILHVLGAALVIQAEDIVEAKASPEEASRALAAVTA